MSVEIEEEKAFAPRRKVFFLHIPKAGGSSINGYLRQSGRPGVEHCEHILAKDSSDDIIFGNEWLSGHLPLEHVEDRLGPSAASFDLFSVVRDPKRQVISHINWMYEIYQRGPEFFFGHTREVQLMVYKFLANNKNNAFGFISLMMEYSHVFLNVQSRYLVPELIRNPRPEVARRGLSRFEYVGSVASLDKAGAIISRHLGKEVPYNIEVFENRSARHLGEDIMRNPHIDAFLDKYNAADEILYKEASNKFDWG